MSESKKEYMTYDEAYKLAYEDTKENHPEKTEEECQEEAKKQAKLLSDQKHFLALKIVNKYQNSQGINGLMYMAYWYDLLSYFPEELYDNINEWIDEEPFSDIAYCGVTMNDIVKDSQLYGIKFPTESCIRAMMVYQKILRPPLL